MSIENPRYLVAGMPRSRTAWLAAALSCGPAVCLHEAANGCRTLDQYREKIAGKGDASTTLSMMDVVKLWPDVPLVIVDSGYQKVLNWCSNQGIEIDLEVLVDARLALKRMAAEHPRALLVEFDWIDARFDSIFDHCYGRMPSVAERDRIEVLKLMNIQEKSLERFDIDTLPQLIEDTRRYT